MNNWIWKINELNGVTKFIVRIIYPILLFIVLYMLGTMVLNITISVVQVIFILVWAYLEWRVFFSHKYRKNK
ncbi:MAG: hypothetical protein JJT77_09250 [Crocinitomicaceae bacterium]|nr:hypothetical protein [Crocinitomicaceae bacterium]